MYLRHTTVQKSGKTHCYWRLVRSVRRGRKVVQETVAQLGELDAEGRARARTLAAQITGRPEQLEIFEAVPLASEPVAVRLDQVRLERARRFGDVWLGWRLWCALELDQFCQARLPAGRECVPWAAVAAILVIARLCEPSSELHTAEDWYRRTALDDLLGVSPAHVDDNRLYRALDQLLPHKRELEAHLRQRLGTLFELDYELLLYDITSTYFEGEANRNALAQRGYSRDHRPDCKQVCIGLVVTRDGMPLGYEVFAGNRTDVTTVEEIVDKIERQYGRARRVWVMDRGMAAANTIAWLQNSQRQYLIGAQKDDLKRLLPQISDPQGWQYVRDGIEAKVCAGPDGKETFLLVRSAERQHKEQAIHARFCQQIETALARLQQRIARARKPIDRSKTERQIGRLLGRNSRSAARYTINLVDAASPARLRLEWFTRPEWDQWAHHSEGCYLLRSNLRDWSAEELWRTYIQLSEAEAAFRIHKSELSIRPVWHQRADRVLAHILICFLAYALWKTLEKWQSRAGLGNSPRTVLQELGAIQSTDVILPTATVPQRELRLRCIVRPDPAQSALLQRLGLRLPERLRIPLATQMLQM
jgi:transposase